MDMVFFFEFGDPKVTVHKGAETIQGRNLYEEIRYLERGVHTYKKVAETRKLFSQYTFLIGIYLTYL